MATKVRHVKAIIQLRRGTEAEWDSKNPVLVKGEPAYSVDVNKLKIGDGIHTWRELDYIGTDYFAGNGIIIDENDEISLDDLILDCGTSTTNIGGGI